MMHSYMVVMVAPDGYHDIANAKYFHTIEFCKIYGDGLSARDPYYRSYEIYKLEKIDPEAEDTL